MNEPNKKIRLQKYMADLGLCSRRKAEEWIAEGKVKVNGETITAMGVLVQGNETVEIEGSAKKVNTDPVTFLFNKPLGVLSSAKDDWGRKTVIDYFNRENYRLYPVGRLDYNTSGALLVSNDGDLTYLVTHPSTHLSKTYWVTVRGQVSSSDLTRLREGIPLEDGMTEKAEAEIVFQKENETSVRMTIYEGRNRQIRRMFEFLGYSVKNLNRESVGFLTLDGLRRGEYRKLSEKEVSEIKRICTANKKNNRIPDYKRK